MSFGTQCHYVRFDGQQCGSPALRGKVFCYYHARSRSNQQANIVIPQLDSHEAAVYAERNLLQLMLNRKITVNELRAAVYCMRHISSSISKFNPKPADTVTDVSRHVSHEIAFAGPDADIEEQSEDQLVQALPTAETNHAAAEQSLSPVAPPPSETPQLSAALNDAFIPGPGEMSATDLHQRRPIPRPAKLPPASDPNSPFAFAEDTLRPLPPNDGTYPRRTTDALRDYLDHEARKRGYGT